MSDDVGSENIPSQKAFERLGYEKIGYGKNINNSPESGKERFVYMKKF
jgi:RimJ/RimL family protein N-acetyltransferase